MATSAFVLLIIGFGLLLGGFVVVAVPNRFGDDRTQGSRSMAGGYGFQPTPDRSQLLLHAVAAAGLLGGAVLVIGSQLFSW